MNLKAKIIPIIAVAFGFVFLSANSVFAYDANYQDTFVPTYNSGANAWYLPSGLVIPAAQITGQCNSNAGLVRLYNEAGTFIGNVGQFGWAGGSPSDCSSIASVGSWTFPAWNIGLPSTSYYYAATGKYYLKFVSFDVPSYVYVSLPFYVDKELNTMSQVSLIVEGVCGTGNGSTLTTIPPEGTEACASGEMINFSIGYDELGTALNYVWLCEGSGGGSSSACASANVASPVAGVCGTADGQTISAAPLEYEMCDVGSSHGSLTQTLAGWTWSCYGFNEGSTDFCSAIYGAAETPPEIPETADVPTPTDCDTYSGIDKVLCNFGNTIQGMFLPSSSKLTELQTSITKIGNIFPFNYLRAIGSVFTNASTITEGGLTMTIMGNTETLTEDFFDLPLIGKIKDFFTLMIYLAFIWWAIAYIKHFFK